MSEVATHCRNSFHCQPETCLCGCPRCKAIGTNRAYEGYGTGWEYSRLEGMISALVSERDTAVAQAKSFEALFDRENTERRLLVAKLDAAEQRANQAEAEKDEAVRASLRAPKAFLDALNIGGCGSQPSIEYALQIVRGAYATDKAASERIQKTLEAVEANRAALVEAIRQAWDLTAPTRSEADKERARVILHAALMPYNGVEFPSSQIPPTKKSLRCECKHTSMCPLFDFPAAEHVEPTTEQPVVETCAECHKPWPCPTPKACALRELPDGSYRTAGEPYSTAEVAAMKARGEWPPKDTEENSSGESEPPLMFEASGWQTGAWFKGIPREERYQGLTVAVTEAGERVAYGPARGEGSLGTIKKEVEKAGMTGKVVYTYLRPLVSMLPKKSEEPDGAEKKLEEALGRERVLLAALDAAQAKILCAYQTERELRAEIDRLREVEVRVAIEAGRRHRANSEIDSLNRQKKAGKDSE